MYLDRSGHFQTTDLRKPKGLACDILLTGGQFSFGSSLRATPSHLKSNFMRQRSCWEVLKEHCDFFGMFSFPNEQFGGSPNGEARAQVRVTTRIAPSHSFPLLHPLPFPKQKVLHWEAPPAQVVICNVDFPFLGPSLFKVLFQKWLRVCVHLHNKTSEV